MLYRVGRIPEKGTEQKRLQYEIQFSRKAVPFGFVLDHPGEIPRPVQQVVQTGCFVLPLR